MHRLSADTVPARGARGLADLACALATGNERMVRVMAGLLQVEEVKDRAQGGRHKGQDKGGDGAGPQFKAGPVQVHLQTGDRDPVPFWRLEHYQPVDGQGMPEQPIMDIEQEDWPDRPPPQWRELAPWRELQPRLRGALKALIEGRELDGDELIRRASQGRLLQRLPYRRYPGWGSRVRIVIDRSEHLTPYWRDQEQVIAVLTRILPRHHVELALYQDGWDGLEPAAPSRSGRQLRLPAPGSLVLVLGDLGCLAADAGEAGRRWGGWGARWREAGCRLIALVPCAPARVRGSLRQLYRLLPWERPGTLTLLDREDRREAAQRLLCLLSASARIEPGLLRAVRLALGPNRLDAAVESEVWQHPALPRTRRSSIAAALDPEAAEQLRSRLAAEPGANRTAAFACLHQWRAGQPPEIWCEEVLTLAALGQQRLLPDPGDLDRARRFFLRLSQQGRGLGPEPPPGSLRWYRRSEQRMPDAAWRDSEVGPALQRLTWALHKDEPGFNRDHRVAPEHSGGDEPLRRFTVVQRGDRLTLQRAEAVPAFHGGSPLALLPSRSGRIDLAPQPDDFWLAGTRPSWVDAYDRDGYGAWVEFVLDADNGARVRQRLRWIPPGGFVMGSPADEPGRYDDEGPSHRVSLEEGFWLFDTPCTQALWQAVMGENPSEFQSPERPVEQVGWDDCREFLNRINQRLPGLGLGLPSEAQWEYACRAETEGAIFIEGYKLLGESNAPALDPIAWYGGNSGRDFELENGQDATDWPEKQYEFDRAGTHPVGLKRPNPWGLYDMLGNVWEWTADAWHDDYKGAPEDGSVWEGPAGAERVVRGGSWYDVARNCRCACRGQDDPGFRGFNLGFRPARVQSREQGQAGAESALPASGRQAERRLTLVPADVAAALTLRGEVQQGECPHPETPAFAMNTDCARLVFQRLLRPAWARAMGRDRCGLWAEISLDASDGTLVRQRLRWIPPGPLRMGSPDNEPGRRDTEGPVHEVLIEKGYWLFDTPCTQALWQAVMDDNPSEFQSPGRPVEQVSWEDCRVFLDRINRRVDGLELGMPSEAQWEYACRAGASTAIYTGDMDILGDANAPALDAVAWYGGNSMVKFHLENGIDLDFHTDRQHGSGLAGTHPVRGKLPNAWGLYDMLGNVWEWTADAWHEDYKGAPVDGSAWQGPAGAGRVVRGGSWFSEARHCRCACRSQDGPGGRDYDLGFRPARVQS